MKAINTRSITPMAETVRAVLTRSINRLQPISAKFNSFSEFMRTVYEFLWVMVPLTFWPLTFLPPNNTSYVLLYCTLLREPTLYTPNTVWSFCDFLFLYRVAQKKRGHHLIANILKFHDRIAWKLVNFCNIICWSWTQSLTFCLKISSRCGAT